MKPCMQRAYALVCAAASKEQSVETKPIHDDGRKQGLEGSCRRRPEGTSRQAANSFATCYGVPTSSWTRRRSNSQEASLRDKRTTAAAGCRPKRTWRMTGSGTATGRRKGTFGTRCPAPDVRGAFAVAGPPPVGRNAPGRRVMVMMMEGPPVEVIKISPRGYCYGVVDAINLAKKAALDPHVPMPVHILGAIVHNRHAVASLEQYGIISLDGDDREALLDQVKGGTVIFPAHGVSPAVKRKAKERGLYCIDATCPDVTRTHALVRNLAAKGYTILYIGKRGHPEPEGVIGEAPDHVHLIETEADVDALAIDADKVAVTTQTTLSKWDTQRVIDYIV